MEDNDPKWMSVGAVKPGSELALSLTELEQRLHNEKGWDYPTVGLGAVYSTPFSDEDLLGAITVLPEEEIRAATQADTTGVMAINLMWDLPTAVQESPHTGLEIMVDLMIRDLFEGQEGLEWFGELVTRPGFVGLAFILNSAHDKIRSTMFYSRLLGIFLISREGGDGEPTSGWLPEWTLDEDRDKVFTVLVRLNELAHFVRIGTLLDDRLQSQELLKDDKSDPREVAELN